MEKLHVGREDGFIKDDLEKWFDASNYKLNNLLDFPRVNKKVMGVLKDGLGGEIFDEFVGLRSKMYAVRVYNSEKDQCKDKGVISCVTKW